MLEYQQCGANVACSQADLTEATKCAIVARFEFQRTRDVVEAIVVTLLDESQRCSSSAIGSRWMAGIGCCGVLGEAPESSVSVGRCLNPAPLHSATKPHPPVIRLDFGAHENAAGGIGPFCFRRMRYS